MNTFNASSAQKDFRTFERLLATISKVRLVNAFFPRLDGCWVSTAIEYYTFAVTLDLVLDQGYVAYVVSNTIVMLTQFTTKS